jgi:hypothetical protein
LTDLDVRKIASEWHGGGGYPLHILGSSGAIPDVADLVTEIRECIAFIDDPDTRFDEHWTKEVAATDREQLVALIDYAERNGKRGEQPGWANLTW